MLLYTWFQMREKHRSSAMASVDATNHALKALECTTAESKALVTVGDNSSELSAEH